MDVYRDKSAGQGFTLAHESPSTCSKISPGAVLDRLPESECSSPARAADRSWVGGHRTKFHCGWSSLVSHWDLGSPPGEGTEVDLLVAGVAALGLWFTGSKECPKRIRWEPRGLCFAREVDDAQYAYSVAKAHRHVE